jgi:hypothetical protein
VANSALGVMSVEAMDAETLIGHAIAGRSLQFLE